MRFAADNVANRSVVDALHQFHKRGTISNLETHVQTEFSLGAFPDLDHLQGAGHVNGHGFLEVDVLSASNDGFQMLRMIIGRRGNHHGVYFFGGCHLLIGFRANENLRSVNCLVSLALLHLVEMLFGVLQLILEHVGQRRDSSVARIHKVRRIFCAASATSEQSHANRGIRSRAAHQLRLNQHRPRRSRRHADKLPAVQFI